MKNPLRVPSDKQNHIITNIDGVTMVLAGPGAGKTFALTQRIAHIIKLGEVDHQQILALTFTNKAAKEMRKRIEKELKQSCHSLWIGTFHSLFSRILRIESAYLGYTSEFSIYDRDESLKLIKKIILELKIEQKEYNSSFFLEKISKAKRNLMDASDFYKFGFSKSEDERDVISQVYKHYEARCKKQNIMDFDDLIFKTYKLLITNSELASKYKKRFRYVLVDEFQDTNQIQYQVIKILSKGHGNLCVIGDDAQAIYGFRGSDIKIMLKELKNDFPSVEVVKLTQNYRSTKSIVDAANQLIKKNQSQYQKNLFTKNEEGSPVNFISYPNKDEEALGVVKNILLTISKYGVNYSQFAVLYRTNRQSKSIEQALRLYSIPYKIRGGNSFYNRKEIKDIIAYLNLLINTDNEQAIERVINLPRRGIGARTWDKISSCSKQENRKLWDVLCDEQTLRNLLTNTVVLAISEFTQLIKKYKSMLLDKDAYKITMSLVQESGLDKMLYVGKQEEELGRYEIQEQFLNDIKKFVEEEEKEKKLGIKMGVGNSSLSRYLERSYLLEETNNSNETSSGKVVIMTIHSSKGLEFDYVYLVGMSEGLMPLGPYSYGKNLDENRSKLEEERRLFYVALTRGAKKVILSHASLQERFDPLTKKIILKETKPSLFLSDVSTLSESSNNYKQSQNNNKPRIPSYVSKYSNKENWAGNNSCISKNWNSRETKYRKKNKLYNSTKSTTFRHPKFGIGKIIEISKTVNGQRTRVDFGVAGIKTFIKRA